MNFNRMRVFGRLQVILGLVSAGLCLLAFVWMETSIGGVLTGLAGASRDLSREVDQERVIVVENRKLLDDTVSALEQYGQTVQTVKKQMADFDRWAPQVQDTSDQLQGVLGQAQAMAQKLGDWMAVVGIPDGIADWGVAPPRLKLSWGHPLAKQAEGAQQLAKETGGIRDNLKKLTPEVVQDMHEATGAINSSCDATVQLFQATNAATRALRDQKVGETVEHMAHVSEDLEHAAGGLDATRSAMRLLIIVAAAGSMLLAFNGYGFSQLSKHLLDLSAASIPAGKV